MSDTDKQIASAQDDEGKPYWHCFWPLLPPPPDRTAIKLLASVEMASDEGWRWHACLMGRQDTIDVLAVSVPADFMRREDEFQALAGGALNRLFGAASVIYSSHIKLISMREDGFLSFGCFSDDQLPRSYPIEITLPQPWPLRNWDLASILNLMAHTADHGDALAALSEAMRADIPRHYRFLALYRALELLIPDKPTLTAWLDRYEEAFRALAMDPKLFRNFAPQLRARCAHGAGIGRERAIFGVISSEVAPEVFDLLLEAVLDKLAEIAGFRLQVTKPDYGPIEPENLSAAEVD